MHRDEAMERMKALARKQPLGMLAEALVMLDAKPKLDPAERLARHVLIDVICERSPEADAAFTAWSEDDNAMGTAVQAITGAIRK